MDLIIFLSALRSTRFAHDTLRSAGFAQPRLGVAALNPHAGDGGDFGSEEIDVIAPAVRLAVPKGLDVAGSLPSDANFLQAKDGRFDVVATMFHDQGRIAMKLMGFGRGVTGPCGLPVPVALCCHGKGSSYVGRGIAKTRSFRNAFEICRSMAEARRGGT